MGAGIPRAEITRILNAMQGMHKAEMTIYLRTASINIYNGMVSPTFSCDGSHCMNYDEYLAKGVSPDLVQPCSHTRGPYCL